MDRPLYRITLYLTGFKKDNPESYRKYFGEKKLETLTSDEFRRLFRLATTHDKINLETLKDE